RPDPARARGGAVRRRAPARADDARRLRGHARVRRLPDRDDAPRLGRPRLASLRHPLLGVPARPGRRAHRRLAGGRAVRQPLAARRVPDRPERRSHPRPRRPQRPRPHRRLRRTARPAQGARRPVAGVAAHPPGNRRAPAADRHGPAAVPAAADAPPLRRDRHRRAGDRPQRGANPRAAAGEGVRLAGPRPGELRPRRRRGVRMRDARGGIEHPRVCRGRDTRVGAARHPGRPGRARRRGRRRPLRRGAPRRDGPRRARARGRELLVGRHRPAARGDLRRGDRVKAKLGLLVGVLALLAAAVALIVWRGPDWHAVRTAFTAVTWEWVLAAIGLNLLSVITRSVAWDTAIEQSVAPPRPSFPLVFSAFCVGLFGNAVLPGRVGELARVAVLRRRMPGRKGTTATLIGSVFAHRMFDLFPSLTLVVWVLFSAKIPGWAYTSLAVVL